MAKKKKQSKSKPARDPERALRNKRYAIAALVVVAGASAFVGAHTGLGALNERAIGHLTPGNPEIAIAWPRWANGDVWLPQFERDRLAVIVRDAAMGGRALSREPLAEIGTALYHTGWFDEPPVVRWTAEGTIEIEGQWRAFAAAVRMGPREHLIDYNGRLLPLDYPSGHSNMIYLLNPSQPKPSVGEAWGGEDLRSALDLIQMLQKEGLLEQVAGVDLGEGRSSGRLAIISDSGSRVVWGGGPDHLRPGEQPTSVKLKRLHGLMERTGRIDGGVEFVDLRGQQILIERTGG